MCLKVYKGIYRGAFALVVSYLEVEEFSDETHAKIRSMVGKYLNDNGVNVDFSREPHRFIVTMIIKAGWSVCNNYSTMDEALEELSRSLELPL